MKLKLFFTIAIIFLFREINEFEILIGDFSVIALRRPAFVLYI